MPDDAGFSHPHRPTKTDNVGLLLAVGGGTVAGVWASASHLKISFIGILLFPPVGACLGALIYRILFEKGLGSDVREETTSDTSGRRRDRWRLALVSFILGAISGVVPGFVFGGPILLGGMIIGLSVGFSMFLGLAVSTIPVGFKKRE